MSIASTITAGSNVDLAAVAVVVVVVVAAVAEVAAQRCVACRAWPGTELMMARNMTMSWYDTRMFIELKLICNTQLVGVDGQEWGT